MDDRDESDRNRRIRERAYRLWQDEGGPEGRADVHWDQATELVAIEENHGLAMERVPSPNELGPSGEPIEPIEAVQNAGEFPTKTDQGEQTFPSRRKPQAASSGKPAATGARPAAAKAQKPDVVAEKKSVAAAKAEATPSGKASSRRAPRK